jgi:ABC-type nitrate/sulfonate/bicarbonate transport system substrate-binding protein
MQKLQRFGITMLLAMLALPGSAWPEDERQVVRLAGSAWVGDGPTKVADALGLFNQGLRPGDPRIEVLDLGSGLEAVQMLMRGEVELALAATTPVALALIGAVDGPGSDLKEPVVLASLALSNQTHKLVMHPERAVAAPGELAGRRIGVMHSTSSHFGWSLFASFHGLDGDRVELVDLPVSRMGAALLNNQIDAALIWEPWDRIVAEELGQTLPEFPLRMLYTVNWLLLTDRQFAQTNPELLARVLRAYLAALAFIDSQPDEAARLHAERAGLPLAELTRRTDGILWRMGMNWSVLVNLGAQFEWLASWPALAGRPIPEPGEYLLAAPLARLAPELVTLPDYLLISDRSPEQQP